MGKLPATHDQVVNSVKVVKVKMCLSSCNGSTLSVGAVMFWLEHLDAEGVAVAL